MSVEGQAAAAATPAIPPPPTHLFGAFRQYNYRLYFGGQLVSLAGTWMQTLAQAWLVLQLSHSAFAVGFISATQSLPILCGSLFASVFIDRVPKHRLLITTQCIMFVQATVLAVLTLTGNIQLWEVFVLALALGIVNAFDNPARFVFVSELVGRDSLVNAVGLNSTMINGARLVGPALAGLVIAVWGVGPCFLLNAISFLVVLVALLLMRPADFHVMSGKKKAGASVLGDLTEALRYIFGRPELVSVIIVLFGIGCFGFNFNTLLPLLSQNALHVGPEGFGALTSAIGLGAVLAGLITASAGRPRPRRMFLAAAGFSLFELGLAANSNFPLAVLLAAAFAFCGFLFTTNANSTLQLGTPDRMRGRVMGLYSTLIAGTTPIGALLTGFLAETIGIRLTMVTLGSICLASAAIAFAYRQRTRMSAPVGAGELATAGSSG